jgi:hypothetical protein
MADIGSVSKDRENRDQKYKFRGIEDLYNAAHPAMTKHGIFCAPEVLEYQVTERQRTPDRDGNTRGASTHIIMRVRHRFYAEDGSYVDVTTTGEGLDTSDKSANKCLSAAFKYALIELFCVPTEDIADADRETPEGGTPRPVMTAPVTFKRPTTTEALTPVGPTTPVEPNVQTAQPAPQKRTRVSKAVANGDEYISLEQQDWLRMKFKEALPLKYQGDGFPESTRHGWLQTNGFMDPSGVGTSKVIKVSQFKDVATRMLAFAKNMQAADDRQPEPSTSVVIDDSEIPF